MDIEPFQVPSGKHHIFSRLCRPRATWPNKDVNKAQLKGFLGVRNKASFRTLGL